MNAERDEPTIRRYWLAFLDSLAQSGTHPPDHFEAWGFGNSPEMANELGQLVRKGRKCATASLVWMFEAGLEPWPNVGDYHIILDGAGKPICIIQTTSLEVLPFDEVGEEHAYLEGEGDRSLRYWREAHWSFFTEECEKLGRVPSRQMPVLCEAFALVYNEDR